MQDRLRGTAVWLTAFFLLLVIGSVVVYYFLLILLIGTEKSAGIRGICGRLFPSDFADRRRKICEHLRRLFFPLRTQIEACGDIIL